MSEKAICLIGYQDIPADKQNYVRQELKQEVQIALDLGYRRFLAEYTTGLGTLFIQCVNEYREQYQDIFLEVVLYNPEQSRFTDKEQELLSKCNCIRPLLGDYKQDYPLAVTRYLAGTSGRVIVVHAKQINHDTAYALDYALTMGRSLRIIQT